MECLRTGVQFPPPPPYPDAGSSWRITKPLRNQGFFYCPFVMPRNRWKSEYTQFGGMDGGNDGLWGLRYRQTVAEPISCRFRTMRRRPTYVRDIAGVREVALSEVTKRLINTSLSRC